MEHLEKTGMDEAIKAFAKSGKPLLGICLGMQLLLESSEEFGSHKGLGLIPGKVVHFDKEKFPKPLKVPHMGWNELFVKQKNPLLENLPEAFYLYFVHSYHAQCDEKYMIPFTATHSQVLYIMKTFTVFNPTLKSPTKTDCKY